MTPEAPPNEGGGDSRATTIRARLSALGNVPAALRLVATSSPRLVAWLASARVLAALVPFGSLFISKRIIDLVVGVTAKGSALRPADVWGLLAAGFGLAVLALVLGRVIDYLEARLADDFSRSVSLRVLEQAAALDLASFESSDFYDTLERARVQATDRTAMLTAFGSMLQRLIGSASLGVSIGYYDLRLLVILVACLVPTLAAESELAMLGYALAHRLTPLRRELDYLLLLGSSRDSAKEVKTFGLAGHLRDWYRAVADELVAMNRSMDRRRLRWGSGFAMLGSMGYYGSYAYLVWQTLRGALSVGTLTFLAGAVAAAQSELQIFFSLLSLISQQALFLGDLLSFLRAQPKIASPPEPKRMRRPIQHGLEFRDVSFAYAGGSPVLDALSLAIHRGEHVAIVGENGAGKTTLVKLIARLYDPTGGQILLDGVDLREYEVDDLRRQIGIIFQDFFRYDMSVRENVAAGQIDRLDDDRALWEALRQSGADAIVEHLPSGLEQILGRRFRHGVDLSGGQWQSLALARAYLRDAQVLVLDEPTAALDANAEAEVFDHFAALTAQHTAILISHRFSTVRMAQRIVLLRDGRVGEEGSHESLVAAGGEYARLFDLQASNYRR